jgi:hypothetical protein
MKWLFCLLLIWHSEIFYRNDDVSPYTDNGITFESLKNATEQATNFATKHRAVSIQIIQDTDLPVYKHCLLIWAEEKK